MPMARTPVVFLPHGGGPWPWMAPRAFGPLDTLRAYLSGLPGLPEAPPRAILLVTAHWEAPRPTVSSGARPGMLYDYAGFPPHTYEITWPAPGDPALARRVQDLLAAAGFDPAEDPARGFDHGTFVPLAVAYPEAQIPTVQLSLIHGLDPDTHLAMGRALRPLRDEGVFVIGSGMSYHDMRGFGTARGAQDAERFDAWLQETVRRPFAERDEALRAWAHAPSARACHPREEHLMPLLVAAGAAGEDPGRVPFSDLVLGTRVSAVHFG